MFRKIVVVGVLLMGVVLFGAASADSGGTKIWFEEKKNIEINSKGYVFLMELVRSFEELQPLYNKHNFSIYQGVGEWHDENYFTEKALILYSFNESSGSISNRIDAVRVQDETLIINIARIGIGSGQHGSTEIKQWIFLIEVNQGDVASITDIRVDTKTTTRSSNGCRGCS